MNIKNKLTPLVSVVLPVNRDDGFLDMAIESVLSQSLNRIELLLIANNCSDTLWQDLQKWLDIDSRVRLFRTSIGQLPFNLNLGIEHACGNYIARMDADDICEVTRLEEQLKFLDLNSDIDIVGSNYIHINERNQLIGHPKNIKLTHACIIRRLPFESCMPHPTVMFRKDSILKIGGYAYGLYAEDWDLWLRLARAGGRFANLEKPLLQYRIHSGQSTSLQSIRRNLANVVALHTREFLLTGRLIFLTGAIAFMCGSAYRLAVQKSKKQLKKYKFFSKFS